MFEQFERAINIGWADGSRHVHFTLYNIQNRKIFFPSYWMYIWSRGVIWGAGGVAPKEQEKRKKRKRKKEKKERKKGTMNNVKLIFFQFLNSPMALKNI